MYTWKTSWWNHFKHHLKHHLQLGTGRLAEFVAEMATVPVQQVVLHASNGSSNDFFTCFRQQNMNIWAKYRLLRWTRYYLVVTNIVMDNPRTKWWFSSLGKSSISMGHGFHGYVSHNQRVEPRISACPSGLRAADPFCFMLTRHLYDPQWPVHLYLYTF